MSRNFLNRTFLRDKRIQWAALGIGTLVLVGVMATAAMLARGKTAGLASASDSILIENEAADVIPLNIDGALFPAVDVEVPTKEPAPEYIRDGVQHDIVADLQERLMELGFMEEDEPTVFYGPVTQSAVKVFQRQVGLPQDGIVGKQTLEAIMDENAKPYAAKLNDVGEDITRIQQRLYDLGYLADSSMISGNFGEKTEEAVRRFQERNALPVDGTVGIQTLNTFYSEEVKANMSAFGEKSDIVLALQNRLFSLGYMTSTPDGTYGTDTLNAVKRFQSKNNIVVDGYLGPETRIALNADTALPNSLDIGDSGDQVKNVQDLLVKWGYLTASKADGYYGESTKAAVSAFQSRNSLGSDGQVGAITIAKLTSDNVLRPLPPARSNNSSSRNNNTSSTRGGSTPAAPAAPAAPSPAPASNTGGVSSLISIASSKVGTPYVWGAKGPSAFDCSGFVYWCLNNAGVSQSYLTSSGWRSARYTRVSNFSDIQAGDIVVVSGHVGIAAGGGEVIDASSSNGRVVRRSLSGWWERKFIVAWRIF